LVEQRIENPRVAGSIPAPGTIDLESCGNRALVPPRDLRILAAMIIRPTRRAFVSGGLLFAFGAGAADAQTADADSMTIGHANAPLHLVEYASMTCPHCAEFHHRNWAALKSNYIDTGRLRLTLHEMLTQPAQGAFAMFQLARAANADAPEYFRRVASLFERQQAIFANVSTVGDLVNNLAAAGAEWGLTREQVMESLRDPAAGPRMERSLAAADAQGVTATPTFILNGMRLGADFQASEAMVRTLDAALAR
jgi:protein-disulfide isomerase